MSDAAGTPGYGPGRAGWATLAVAAATGFALLAVVFPAWTDNVESAQVVAGIVRYPPDNPMGIYHLSVVSLLIDPAALLLRLGLSEWMLSALSSGIQGAVVFAALAAVPFALSRSPVLAMLVPLAMLALQVRPGSPPPDYPYLSALHGHGYPILLAGYPYIYGTVGLFSVLLAWGLAALRADRTAAFLSGLLPWIHASMAAAGWIGLAVAGWCGRARYPVPQRRRILGWFALGCLLSTLGIAGHRMLLSPDPAGGDAAAGREVAGHFMANWDGHRVLPAGSVLPMLEADGWLIATFAVLILLSRRRELSAPERFLGCCAAAVAVPGAACLLATGFAPDLLPVLLRAAMPYRWLNLNSAALPAVALGILGRHALREGSPVAAALLTGNAVLLLTGWTDAFTVFSRLAGHPGEGVAGVVRGLSFPMLGCAGAWLAAWRSGGGGAPDPGASGLPRAATAAVVLVAAALLVGRIVPAFRADRFAGRDRHTPLMRALSRGEGMVLLAGPFGPRVQLRARRPVLVDPSQLDLAGYVPEAAHRMERIFVELYGGSLLRAREPGEPPDAIWSHLLPRHWPELSVEAWQEIRAEHGVTAVLMPGGVPLRLPVLEGSGPASAAYSIPPPVPGADAPVR